MGTRENKVETYLRDEAKLLGGDSRKWVSPGHDGVPDQITFLFGKIYLVEVKTVDGKYEPTQPREHVRLRELGATVCTVFGKKGVDKFLSDIVTYTTPLFDEYR